MKILMVGADCTNPTDGVIVQGILKLLKVSYDEFIYNYIFLNDHAPMEESELYPYSSFDLIVICGTPWLWDNFQLSEKYKNLKRIFNIHSTSKKLFMGIGTCINFQDTSTVLKRPAEIEGMKDLFSNSKIIVRERLAKDRLKLAALDSILLPCPAYFCYDSFNFSSRTKNIMIWCDPQKTISSGDWNDSEKLKQYYEIYKCFYKLADPEVYCAFPEEIDKAVEIGLPEPKVLRGFQDTMDLMKQGNHVLSGRVHCAVPAYSAGCSTYLTSLDTRAFTFRGYVINNKIDLLNGGYKPNTGQIEKYKVEYIQILRSI